METLRNKILSKHYPLPGSKAHQKLMPSSRRKSAYSNTTIQKKAAVLIPIFETDSEYRLLLIKRPEYNGVHSNQVSFPGGKTEKEDLNLMHTALRETFEEIGVQTHEIEIVCELSPLHIPVSGFEVTPYIGFLKMQEPKLTINKKEVQYVIDTSLSHLQKSTTLKTTTMQLDTEMIDVPYFDIDGEIVWGATAMILSELLDILNS